MQTDTYNSPFNARYASKEMQYIYSPDFKFKTWRKLWIALAEAEHELGLNVTQAQIDELKAHAEDINYDVAREREKLVRHDVMSHVYAYGVQCPTAKPIIHLGATSCYVGDNTDVITMREALLLIKKKLVNAIASVAKFADQYKDMPCLGFTHFQPAQPTTVGKRATLWLMDLVMDYEEVCHVLDTIVCNCLGLIAQSCCKFSNDLRLLQNLKEIEEPFEKNQIGSSAMAYKRNPMRSERIASLSRYVMIDALNPAWTASAQWFERTLDDSANKRVSVAEAFLATDGILDLYINVTSGLVVYPKVIHARLMSELPFMATENIMMDAVKKGGDRQELHEKIRQHSMAAGAVVKVEGGKNDLVDRIAADPAFMTTKEEILAILKPENFVGRAPEQTADFLNEVVDPILAKEKDLLGVDVEINV